MSQDRIEYWWKFITDLETLYLLALNKVDNVETSEFYADIKRAMDYIYGFNQLDYDQGIVYGHSPLPSAQYIFNGYYDAGDGDTDRTAPAINYNTKCVNVEYSSAPNGGMLVNPGSLFFGGKIQGNMSINVQSIDNSDGLVVAEGSEESTSSQFVYPPDDLYNAIVTSNLYISSSGQFINKFLRGAYPDGPYITTYSSIELTEAYVDTFGYRKNLLNEDFFYQTPSGGIDVAKIVWRVGDTTDSDRGNHSYEYYIIDDRKFYGYYGWKQVPAISTIAEVNSTITEVSQYDMLIVAKKMFNIVFKEMEWGIPSDFITYWEAVPKDISDTIRDLYDELENIPIGSEV